MSMIVPNKYTIIHALFNYIYLLKISVLTEY